MSRLAFFFDRCFPLPIARMIEHYEREYLCRHQNFDNRFIRTTPDVDIIATLAADTAQEWVMISADKHITTRPTERGALTRSGLRFFCFGRAWFKMDTHQQAWKFLKEWPALIETATNDRRRVFEIDGTNLKIVPV